MSLATIYSLMGTLITINTLLALVRQFFGNLGLLPVFLRGLCSCSFYQGLVSLAIFF